jgi:4-amino-4-deoxy-L-arabinose transferase-like glycosyltransferase
LGWWIALSAAAVGLFVVVARGIGRRSESRLPPDRVRPGEALRGVVRRRSAPHLKVLPRGRALVAIAALPIAYAGQRILVPTGHPFHLGWILLLLGAVVFAVAWRGIDLEGLESATTSSNDKREAVDRLRSARAPFHTQSRPADFDGPVPEHEPAPFAEVEPMRSANAFERAGGILGTGSLLLCIYNDWDWTRHGESSRTRFLWGVSIALLLLALASLRGSAERRVRRDDDLPRLPAMLLLLLIAGIAFFLRFVDLPNVPLDVHGDFASIGLGAREILQGRVPALFATGWASMPWAAYLPAALSMKVFGDSLFGMNMGAVIAGTVTVIGIYCLGSLLLNRSIALLAAAVSAVGYTDIHFSRVSAYIDPVPWMVFGIYFLILGLRSGRALWFGVSGVLLAVGFEMYYSGRLAFLVLILFFAYLAVFHRALVQSRWKGLLFLVIAGVVATGPMLLFHWRFFNTFMARTREVYAFTSGNLKHLLNKYNTESPTRVLVEQVWRSLLTFNYTPDSSTQFGFRHSMVNPMLAPLFVLGTALSAARLRQSSYALLFVWLASGVVVGSILTIDSPFWPRLVVLLPVVAILTGLGIYAAARAVLGVAARRPRPWLVLLPAAGMLALIGHQNWRWYFYDGPRTYVAPIVWVSRQIAQSPPGTAFCMVRGPLNFADRVPQFLAKGHEMLDFPPERLKEHMPRCLAERRIWVIVPPDHDAVLALLNRRWPFARQEQHNFPDGQPGPIFWYPPGPARGGGTAP